MTAQQYRDAVAALGMTQVDAAQLLGVDARTSRRWALAERDVPEPVARFLRYLIARGTTGEKAMRVLSQA